MMCNEAEEMQGDGSTGVLYGRAWRVVEERNAK